MKRLLGLAAAGLLAVLAVAACSSDSTSSSGNPAATNGGGGAATATINIQNFKFGDPVTVKPGDTVKVTNQDTAGHNVVSDDRSSFKTETLQKGESQTFTAPAKPGRYTFSCTLHANMTGIGTLIVQG
jgi:plastocyanin